MERLASHFPLGEALVIRTGDLLCVVQQTLRLIADLDELAFQFLVKRHVDRFLKVRDGSSPNARD
jgi:hypothetical protein